MSEGEARVQASLDPDVKEVIQILYGNATAQMRRVEFSGWLERTITALTEVSNGRLARAQQAEADVSRLIAEVERLEAALASRVPAQTSSHAERLEAALSTLEALQTQGIHLHHANGEVLSRDEFIAAIAAALPSAPAPRTSEDSSHPESRVSEPREVEHSLTLQFRRILSEAEWREVVEAARQLPFVQGLEANASPAEAAPPAPGDAP